MTIKDIAALAGVSPSTVSKVLNNKADSIGEETRETVLRIVKEYNFKPFRKYIHSDSAFQGIVGLLVPGGTREYGDFISGAQEAAGREGYSMVLCTCQKEGDWEKYLSNLFSKGVDGIAMYLDHSTDLAGMFADAPEKLVYVGASNRRDVSGQCEVACDFADAARYATEYLIQAGHGEIALVGRHSHFLQEDLERGYREALYDNHIIQNPNAVCSCDSLEQVEEFVRQFTYGRGTAFLCQDVQLAAAVCRVLAQYGLRVPGDYSVMGLSYGQTANVIEPPLTAVSVQHESLGYAVMEALIEKIEGKTKRSSESKQIHPRLWEGGSVAGPAGNSGRHIVVVGSMNMDVIIHIPHIPTSGESLKAQRLLNLPGGKGANQGVGVAKLGGNVFVIGCLGSDQEGRLLYSSLTENGVNTAGVRIIHEKPSGKAYILVAENGESTIVRAHGANDDLLPDVVKENASCFDGAELCLISTEMPWETVRYTIDYCNRHGIATIVKPTIQRIIPQEVLKKVTFLIPNEKELAVLVEGNQSVEEKAASLFTAGVEHVIVTLGEKGCYLHDGQFQRHFPAAAFQTVDTTGAADAFISALAVHLNEGHDIVSSIQYATYAAGLSVTRDGVQPALADRMAMSIYTEEWSAMQK